MNRHFPYQRRRVAKAQAGFTIVELLVSLGLSILLVLGMTQLYTESKKSYRQLEATSRLLENGRLAMDVTYRSIRLARYWGCAGINDAKVTVHLGYDAADPTGGDNLRGIHGIDNAGLNGSDEITILQIEDDISTAVADVRTLSEDSGDLTMFDPLRDDTQILVASGSADALRTGASWGDGDDFVSVNDCGKADILEIEGKSTSGGYDRLEIAASNYITTYSYNTTASVHKIKKIRLYLATGDSGEPSLFIQEDGGTGAELVEGVEDMQIYYGQDVSGEGNVARYVTPAVINADCGTTSNECWRNVTSVRISLLMRTPETNLTETNQTYSFDGTSQTSTDGRIRREFLTVDSIRNHRE